MSLYLSLKQVLRIHEMHIEVFGGSDGVRDRDALDAAVFRPQSTFGGEDLYPDPAGKAAALLHSLVANHPFVDGNKRTAVTTVELFLLTNSLKLVTDIDEFEDLTMATARGELSAEEIAIWIRQRLSPFEP